MLITKIDTSVPSYKMLSTKRVVLVRHVPGDRLPEPEADLKIEQVELNVELKPNEVLIKNLYLSMDPTMRSWMSQSKGSYYHH
ncbi:hypothetical protein BASA81_008326 [Batrachochytrium salamandrivorans]|nr:hypothetical protein BASA81_008326 [Batrachochytrium salamandrivorans]